MSSEWKISTCVGNTWPLIFPDIYFHSWAQRWPAPPVQDAEDKCQPHPLEAFYAYMHIGNQIYLAYHILRLKCPSFRSALIALCHPPHHCHLIELENGRIVCWIFNGRIKKQVSLILFISYVFSAALCLPTYCAAKFPKSICSSYCENNELVHVMQGLFYSCQIVLYILIVLRLGSAGHLGAHASSAVGNRSRNLREQSLPLHKEQKGFGFKVLPFHWLIYS